MRRVTSLDVRCPTCGIHPGNMCVRLDGTRAGVAITSHEARRRRAADEQARLNPEHVRGQQPLWGKAPS